jgi:putative Holliday junction resolvase
MALDYGLKRCGLATTDPLRIIASPLTTVPTPELLAFFQNYLRTEAVERLVIGQALQADGEVSALEEKIQDFIQQFQTAFPKIDIVRYDERYTSKMASQVIQQTVKKKSKRQDKGLVDQISAAIILQEYLGLF